MEWRYHVWRATHEAIVESRVFRVESRFLGGVGEAGVYFQTSC